jgi:hypothetical protein
MTAGLFHCSGPRIIAESDSFPRPSPRKGPRDDRGRGSLRARHTLSRHSKDLPHGIISQRYGLLA